MEVRQLKLDEKDDLLAFLRRSYGAESRHADATFWEWHFLNAAYTSPDNLPVWVAVESGRIAGLLGAIEVRLNVRGRERRAIWILDLLVDPDFRRRGIAKKLVAAAEMFCPLMLGVNTMEQHAPAMLQSLGWQIVSKIRRFHAMLLPGEAVREISGIGPLRFIANSVYSPFRPRPKTSNFEIRNLDEFDAQFDELAVETRGQWICVVARSAGILRWQYREQPGKRFDVIGCFKAGKLVGYAVVFVRKPNEHNAIAKAAITDISYLETDAALIIDDLLNACLSHALDRRAGSLVTDIIDPLVAERLEKAGFRAVKGPLQLMVKADRDDSTLYDAANWFITRGDSDTSIFEEPNI